MNRFVGAAVHDEGDFCWDDTWSGDFIEWDLSLKYVVVLTSSTGLETIPKRRSLLAQGPDWAFPWFANLEMTETKDYPPRSTITINKHTPALL